MLRLVAEGKHNIQIAEEFVLSEKTVGNHVSVILNKLNVSNRVEAATFAVQHGIRDYERGE